MTVYFAQCETSPGIGPIKIGYTVQSGQDRVKSMRSGCPFPIKFLCAVEGTEGDEILIHGKFKEYRLHHEWYTDTQELTEFVNSVRDNGQLPELDYKEWTTTSGAADYLDVSYDVCVRLCQERTVKAEKVMRRWRIDMESLREYKRTMGER